MLLKNFLTIPVSGTVRKEFLHVAQIVIFHAQVDGADLEGLGQGQDPGVGVHD